MKKVLATILILTLLLSMTACGGSPFKNQAAMNSYLNGIWMVDGLSVEKTYYVFQDGQVYEFSDAIFEYAVNSYMKETAEGKGLQALFSLNWETAAKEIPTKNILRDPLTPVEMKARKGLVILQKDNVLEKHIVIEKDSIGIKYPKENYTKPMVKLSDTTDFSGEQFQTLFNKFKENYAVPTKQYWTAPENFAALVKSLNPEVDSWILTNNTKGVTIYEPNANTTNVIGSFCVSSKDFTYIHKVPETEKWTPHTYIDYRPEEGRLFILDEDNRNLSIPRLFEYGTHAVKQFPGAYQNYMDLYNNIMAEEAVVENGTSTREKNINGVTYKLQIGTDNTWANLIISTNETLTLRTVMENSK